MKLRQGSSLALALLLAACAGHAPRPPVQDVGLSAAPAPDTTPMTYTVQPGDTLYALSLRYDRDYRELARINHLGDDYRIRVGQRLLLNPRPMPKPVAARAKPRPMAGTAAPPPAGGSVDTVPDADRLAATPLPPSTAFPDSSATPPGHHRHRHGIPVDQGTPAATANSASPLLAVPIPEPGEGTPKPPQTLPKHAAAAAVALVPVHAATASSRLAKNSDNGTQVSENKAETDVPEGAGTASSSTKNTVRNSAGSKPVAPDISQKQPPVGSTGGTGNSTNHVDTDFAWAWPNKGPIIGHFGSGGLGNKGLDIAGRRGDAVLAAGDGVVVYVGSGLVGYGKLIIIRHNNNYLSAYAHNDRFYVNEGDSVKIGQKIADVGSSGADRDELHFEIRRQGKPVDPLQYLPPR